MFPTLDPSNKLYIHQTKNFGLKVILLYFSQQKGNTATTKGRQSVFEDWIPWPDIDSLPSTTSDNDQLANRSKNIEYSSAGANHRSNLPTNRSSSPLEGLSKECSDKCRKIHDMGFPLERLAKACKSLGDDDQLMINYCLLVDKILDSPGNVLSNISNARSSSIVEDVVLMHSSDEPKIQKHLESFARLAEFGFEPPTKIHKALIDCDLDYEKALEHMLK